MAVRTRTIRFRQDRHPDIRRISLGFEGDNMVERLEFVLPDISDSQTATLMMAGKYANAVMLEPNDAGRYCIDLSAEIVGTDGEVEAYVQIDDADGKVWHSATMRLVTGALPDVETEIEQRFPTAVETMLTEIAEHRSDMAETLQAAEDAAKRAEDAANQAGSSGGGSNAPGADGGYYTPSVSDTGELTWTASKEGMPAVEAVNIRGPQGEPGSAGADGAKGEAGADGQPGKDGVSATHSWNGTVLTVTSASGTSSADLKGEKGETGAQGPQGEKGETGAQGPQGEKGDTGAQGPKGDAGTKGDKGDTGAAGYTPIKGVDYWTEDDKAAITEEVSNQLSLEIADKVGYLDLDNTVVLDNAEPGEYTIKPEDWSAPIDGCDSIGITVTDDAREYVHLIPENCAPVGTKKLGVYDGSGAKVGDIRPHSNYRRRMGQKLYSFMALADIHLPYDTAAEDFDRAMTYADNNDDIKFVTISGDLSKAGSIEELQDVRAAMDAHTTPVWPATGNHEGVNENIRFVVEQYIGYPLYYKKEYGNDVYLFVGCKSNVTGSLFTKAELQWLYEELELNRNKRCFVFEHVRPEDGCGNALGIYTNDIWGGTEQVVFESLMRHYKNVILFHGHSHLKLYMQEFSDIANYDNLFGCHSVHVPSLAVPRDTTSVVDPSITEIYADSEGYVVDVYEKGIMLRGRDFVAEKFLPIATYWLDTPLHEVPAQAYSDPTGTLDTSVVREIQLAWSMDTGIDLDTGEEFADGLYAASNAIPVSKTLRYHFDASKDYRKGSDDMYLCCYDESGAYIGYIYLFHYSCPIPTAWFQPHAGTKSMRFVYYKSNGSPSKNVQSMTVLSEKSDKFTNQIALSIDSDGLPFNGGLGYKEGYRANSTGGETALSNCKVTGFIPYQDGQLICMSGIEGNDVQNSIHCYDADFNILFYANYKSTFEYSKWKPMCATGKDGALVACSPYGVNWGSPDNTVKYFRISSTTLDADSIITLDEPIMWDRASVPITWAQGIKIEETNGAEVSDSNYTASEMITLDSDAIYEVFCASSHQMGLGYIWYAADGAFLGSTQSVRKTTAEVQAFAMKEVLEPPKNAASMKIRVSQGGYWTVEDVAAKVTMVKKH